MKRNGTRRIAITLDPSKLSLLEAILDTFMRSTDSNRAELLTMLLWTSLNQLEDRDLPPDEAIKGMVEDLYPQWKARQPS